MVFELGIRSLLGFDRCLGSSSLGCAGSLARGWSYSAVAVVVIATVAAIVAVVVVAG